ncbi:MAG: hypothetical protein HYV27_19170 [Candidatus Hydrogenedentes bacterium]|nr:hypothetical protein [Candidatus Hydrogenedentota bacterium]
MDKLPTNPDDGDQQQTVFEQIRAGLEDSLAYSRGELELKTIHVTPPDDESPE